ncbi:hypothetical protein L6452_07780 [Arctium lappa]|uniref:Uncharacterized protein n=1 Tax=Arctium lappa TaxID=4217 RepID=A0ACB9ELZ6_ARCLA|nr:hypothetical protein L6452_07780 [Arctium lappa]
MKVDWRLKGKLLMNTQSDWEMEEQYLLKLPKKLQGCINQVQNRNQSGVSEQDIMNEAKEMLKLDASYKKGFKFDHVWHIMKDCENILNVNATPQYQRQSPYQSPSPGPGSSSGTDVGLPSLNLNDEQGITLTQRPIGVKKAKSKLQSYDKIESLVKASRKMSEAINKNNEVIMKKNEVQAEKNAINTRLADDKIMFTDLDSITNLVFYEFIKNEQNRISRKRAQECEVDTYGQGSEYQGSQYRASQHQGSGEEGVQDQAERSQNVAGNFSHYIASGN